MELVLRVFIYYYYLSYIFLIFDLGLFICYTSIVGFFVFSLHVVLMCVNRFGHNVNFLTRFVKTN